MTSEQFELVKEWHPIEVLASRVMTSHNANLNVDSLTWLHRNCGESIRFSHGVWSWEFAGSDRVKLKFRFKEPNHAMMFKLAWGGL